jgi:hypothetical protein
MGSIDTEQRAKNTKWNENSTKDLKYQHCMSGPVRGSVVGMWFAIGASGRWGVLGLTSSIASSTRSQHDRKRALFRGQMCWCWRIVSPPLCSPVTLNSIPFSCKCKIPNRLASVASFANCSGAIAKSAKGASSFPGLSSDITTHLISPRLLEERIPGRLQRLA